MALKISIICCLVLGSLNGFAQGINLGLGPVRTKPQTALERMLQLKRIAADYLCRDEGLISPGSEAAMRVNKPGAWNLSVALIPQNGFDCKNRERMELDNVNQAENKFTMLDPQFEEEYLKFEKRNGVKGVAIYSKYKEFQDLLINRNKYDFPDTETSSIWSCKVTARPRIPMIVCGLEDQSDPANVKVTRIHVYFWDKTCDFDICTE